MSTTELIKEEAVKTVRERPMVNHNRLPYNIVLDLDSYKLSHKPMYPDDCEAMESYIEARGPQGDFTIFFGLQMLIKKYLLSPVEPWMIDEAEEFAKLHGEPFDRSYWEYIVHKYKGYIPITIKAVKEGMKVPTGNALVTIRCDDKKVFNVGSVLETMILRGAWYPSTIATNSYKAKQIIRRHLEETADSLDSLNFMLHDFGGRGVTCEEQAQIGGAAHLTSFMGSDTISGVRAANFYYGVKGGMAAFSVPAAEHTVTTAEGEEGEIEVFKRILKAYKGWPIISVVSDGYNIYEAVRKWGSLKKEIAESGARLVIRPDSGDPVEVISKVIKMIDDEFGSTVNSKKYKVLNNVRILQGDGVDNLMIDTILTRIRFMGYSAENMVFGSGGALLQKVNRDTYKWAQKSSAIKRNGVWIDVAKNPVTDPGKISKKGRQKLLRSKMTGEFMTFTDDGQPHDEEWEDMLELVYSTGVLYRDQTMDEVREIVEAQ
jgi:nicotinamide phosphoribosyltransferase